jgi:SAM-dependent methyltransferase
MTKPPNEQTLRFGEATKLPAILTKAWRETILEMGKFPKGTELTNSTEEGLLKKLVKSERGAIANLWRTFTSDRDSLTAKTLTDKRNSVAYLLGFHLPNAARTLHAISVACRRASIKPALEGFKKAMIVDLGCGSGAMAQSSLCLLRSLQNPIDDIELRLVDTSAPLLDTAKLLLAKTYPNGRIRTYRGKIDSLLIPKYLPDPDVLGIYNLGYVWNELAKNSRAKGKLLNLMQGLIDKNASALIIVVEPGSQDQSRSTMVLRNRMADLGYHIHYPCPTNRECPMLDRSRDWCYSEITWQPPPIQRLIDKQIGIEREILAASCYVFATPKLAKLIKARTTKMKVVVGRPVKGTRATVKTTQIEYLTCSDSGIQKAPVEAGALPLARGELLEFLLNP